VKHVDEYRDPALVARLAQALAGEAALLERPLRFMEVCGTHTMALGRFGLRELLPPRLDLISGPGCPVCVTATAEVDRAVALCLEPRVVVATFGDLVRVPGSRLSLAQAQAQGGRVRIVYSSLEALDLARKNPDQTVVFLGIGFETTAPTTAAAVLQAAQEGLANFAVLACHKLLPPALEALLADGRAGLDGFLLPGHVTTIIGAQAYQAVARRHGLPGVVAGFEPADILAALIMLLQARGRGEVRLQYRRGAAWAGNRPALAVMERVFRPADSLWRGLGLIPGSGLVFREEFAAFDAAARFGLVPLGPGAAGDPPGCRCGEILQGLIKPPDCPLFGTRCRPEDPVGPCMVSSEGTCAAYHKYHRG
jgi:hydrogenase expression/formation protein HypD